MLLDFLCELYYDARIHEHHVSEINSHPQEDATKKELTESFDRSHPVVLFNFQ